MKKDLTKYPQTITMSFIKAKFVSYLLYQSNYFKLIGNTDLIV